LHKGSQIRETKGCGALWDSNDDDYTNL
jgi:hypothetical protein